MDATPIKAMKKLNLLFSVLLCLSASAVKAEITPNPVFPEPQLCNYGLEIAMSVDNDGHAVFQRALYNQSSNGIEVTVYDPKFAVEKHFTLKNVLKEGYDYFDTEEFYFDSMDEDIIVTRNFLVKNDKWIAVVRNYKENSDDDIYMIFDEDNNLLGELPLLKDAGTIVFGGIDQGTPYLCQYYETQMDEDEYFQLYTFNGTNSIQAVKAASFNAAYPNPLPAGQTFTVDFAEPADDATFFCVIDMNGRQVYRRKLAQGQTTYKLTGSRFGRGNYVYTVVYGDGHAVSGKLIAE